MKTLLLLALAAAVNSSPLTVKKGDHFEIPLKSLSTAGYEWHLVGYDSERVSFKAKERGPLPQSAKLGQSPDEVFVFQALKEGKTELHFAQYRSWEGPEGAKQEVVAVQIRP